MKNPLHAKQKSLRASVIVSFSMRNHFLREKKRSHPVYLWWQNSTLFFLYIKTNWNFRIKMQRMTG